MPICLKIPKLINFMLRHANKIFFQQFFVCLFLNGHNTHALNLNWDPTSGYNVQSLLLYCTINYKDNEPIPYNNSRVALGAWLQETLAHSDFNQGKKKKKMNIKNILLCSNTLWLPQTLNGFILPKVQRLILGHEDRVLRL